MWAAPMKKLSLIALTILSCSPGTTTVSADRSSISASPSSVVADGTTASVVTVVARDTNGSPMVSATVTLQVTGAAPKINRMSNTTGTDGAAAFHVSATTAGTYNVTVTGTDGAGTYASVTFTWTVAGGICSGLSAWSSSTVYTADNSVTYNGDKWTANQWNEDEVPGGPAGAWNNSGSC